MAGPDAADGPSREADFTRTYVLVVVVEIVVIAALYWFSRHFA
jgi:hypothetical protein